MPVPTDITQLSTVASSNNSLIDGAVDQGAVLDDHQRAAYAFIRQLYNVAGTQALLKAQLDSQYVAKTGDAMTGSLTITNAQLGVGAANLYGRIDAYYDGVGGINAGKTYYGFHWGGQFGQGLGLDSSGRLIFGSSNTSRDLTSTNVRFDAQGAFSLAIAGTVHDPFGRMSVTMPADANAYNYYAMTKAGTLGMGIGINSSNRMVLGGSTSGINGQIAAPYIELAADRVIVPSRLERPQQTGFYAYANAGSYTNGQIIVFQVVDHNVNGRYNLANGRFSCDAAGRYSIRFRIEGQTDASSSVQIGIYVNGVLRVAYFASQQNANNIQYFVGDAIELNLSATDIIDIRALAVPAAGLVLFTSDQRCHFSIKFEG